MRLCTYRKGSSKPRIGAMVGDAVLDLGALAADLARERGTVRRGRGGFPKTMLDLVAGGAQALQEAREALAHGETLLKRDGVGALVERKLGAPADKVRLEAPIPRPARNVFCLGRNYKEHAAERGAEAPAHPVYFTKAPETVVGPGAKVIHHAVTKELDYEVELAVVIGETTKNVSTADALNSVFGYTTANDLSARDLQMRTSQWLLGKTMDKFMPIGPYLVTADDVRDPQQLAIRTWLNGELRQNSNTDDMIFPVAEIVSYISRHFTLEPGDVIITGTPEGVILGMAEKRWMVPGDVVEVEVDGLGKLRNRMVAG
jgi:2-keto-4-pentenoate hydratase/2-oxohepta-3-ene-1,7-dioic acid hydratase in catechol pathway